MNFRAFIYPILGIALLVWAGTLVVGNSSAPAASLQHPAPHAPIITPAREVATATPTASSTASLSSEEESRGSFYSSQEHRPSAASTAAAPDSLPPRPPSSRSIASRFTSGRITENSDPLSTPSTFSAPLSISVEPTAPGNTLTAYGQTVAITSISPTPDGDALHVEINDAGPPSGTTEPAAARPTGFTREEELFRAKWGWAAFDRIRKTANAEITGNP